MAEIVESAKLTTFILPFAARTCHALLLATNSCTREELSKRGELTNARSALVGVAETGVNALFDDFWYFWSYKSTIKKSFFKYLRGSSRRRPLQAKAQVQPIEKAKNMYSIPSAQALSPRPHPKFNREVRRSPTWRSSKSESAL